MDAAEHLRLVRIFHFVMAGLMAVLFAGAALAAFLTARWSIGLVVGPVALVLGGLHLVAALFWGRPAGRILSIIAAIVSLPSIPIGTAFGVYALRVHFKFLPEAQA